MPDIFVYPRQWTAQPTGAPYPGAKISFYQVGTLDQLTVYQDSTLETPHDQPVEADDGGKFPVIFLNTVATSAYRIILRNRFGTLIDDIDNLPIPVTLTQAVIGGILYPETLAELAAGVTPTDKAYRPGESARQSAAGNGVTDNTTALQAWASVSQPLELGDGVFKVNDRLTHTKNVTIIGKGSGRTILDFTGATGVFAGSRAVDFSQGTHTALPALSGDPEEGDTTLTFGSAHSLVKGSMIRLLDDSSGSWSGHLSTFTAGEYCIVSEVVSATVVGLTAPLRDSYTAASTDAQLCDYGTVHIEGVTIIGVGTTSGVIPLYLENCRDVKLYDVQATNSGLVAATLRHCHNVDIDGMVCRQYFEESEVGTQQYGLSMIHVQKARVKGDFQGERHGFVTGSTTGGGVVNRGIIVTGNLESLIDCAGDFHGNTEYSAFDGCDFNGAVALGGDRNACRNSTIIGNAAIQQGQPIRFREMKGFNFELSNIYARTVADPSTGSPGTTGVIDLGRDGSSLGANTTRGGTLSISNVRVDAPNSLIGARFINNGCTQQCNIVIDGLDLQINAAASVANGLIRLDVNSGDNFQSISLRGLTGTAGLVRSKINFNVDDLIEEHQEIAAYTPTVLIGGASTGITYGHQTARYEVHGGRVHFFGEILLTSKGALTGNVTLGGLPFTVLNVANLNGACAVQGSAMTFADQLQGVVLTNTTTIALQEVSNAGALTAITNADLTDTTLLRFSGWYFRAY